MKEYIEREALLKDIEEMLDTAQQHINITGRGFGKTLWDGIYKGIKCCQMKLLAAPAADVVEVVRCKDCKYYAAMITDTVSGDMETAPWGICTQPWFNSDEYDVQENGYCSYGERRLDKEE